MITSKEWYIMNDLWENAPATLMEITARMEQTTGWSKSTCATMLRRMTEKKIIGFEMRGKTKCFYPLVDRDEEVVPETRNFLKRIYDGSVGAMMSTLVRQGSLSREDIEELSDILEKAKEQTADRSSEKQRR